MWEQLTKKGYEITNKRVLGNPAYTSEQTKHKDLVQELALVQDWLLTKYGIHLNIDCDCYGNLWYSKLFVASEKNWDDLDKRHDIISAFRKFHNEHISQTEAKIAAIEYTINNLI